MQEAGETLTHSVLLFLHSLIPTCFHCIDCHQQLFSVSVRFPCRSNQSGNIWRNTHIPLQYTFQIVDEVAIPNVRFTVCCPIVFGVICIVQVPIPVKPIIHCRNVFRCAVLRMTVDSSDSANISYLSWSSRAVLCRQSWWPRRSFWQLKCSHTVRLKRWPGWFDDLFPVRIISLGGHLLILSARFHSGSTWAKAALRPLQKVVNLSHSLQFPFLQRFLHFWVIFSVHSMQWWVSTCQNPIIAWSKLPYNNILAEGLSCGFWLPPADNISANRKSGLRFDTMWYDRTYVARNIARR